MRHLRQNHASTSREIRRMQLKTSKHKKTSKHNKDYFNSFDVRRTTLDNGLVVVSEKLPWVRSVSFGVFLRSGSRRESASEHGLTHFIEHALFKGTKNRNTIRIAEETDALGGNLDAFTGRDLIGYYNKVLDEQLNLAFDLTADLVLNPLFDKKELEKERNVILEEIKMVEDTPDDIIFDIFLEKFYPNHPIGRPVLGTPSSLKTFSTKKVREYYERVYTPDNIVVAAAGNIEHDQIIELAEKYFGNLKPSGTSEPDEAPDTAAFLELKQKESLEQSHLVLGFPGVSALSDQRYAATVLATVLGGGMSSRLFQNVREERSLVYTIYSSCTMFKDCGYLSIYAGASPDQINETVNATIDEIHKIKEERVSEEEIERNKQQLKASLWLGFDSVSSRVSSIAQHELMYGRFIPPQEIIDKLEAVTSEDVQQTANSIFDKNKIACVVLGETSNIDIVF